MLKHKYIFVFIFASFLNRAQVNLVQNPSFENYSPCPFTLAQLSFATGWSSYSPTPDYYNLCNGAGGVGVPSNGIGYQAASHGVGYAGLIAFDKNGFVRELIGSQLSQNLIVGQKYYASVKVSLAEFQGPPVQYIPCDKIGIKFSTIPFSDSNPAPITNSAHVYSSSIISDTMSWTIVKGSFIADSTYQYIMVGNFFDDLNTDTIDRVNGVKSYFFIDEVCVSTDSLNCDGFSSVKSSIPTFGYTIYPNPSANLLSIASEETSYLVLLYNTIGKELMRKNGGRELELDVTGIPSGLFFLKIVSNKGVFSTSIIINH